MSIATPNLLDRIVAFVNPRAGLDRIRARTQQELMVRHFEGASTGRRTQYWTAPSSGPNTALIPAIRMMRNRARDLGRNNPWGKRAVRVIVSNTVGTGIRPRPYGPDAAAVDRARAAWKIWASTTQCDADGRENFYGLQKMALRTIAESGEVLVRRRRRRSRDGLAVPIQLQMLEPDHMDSRRDYFDANGNRILQGIKFDALGRRQGYWLFPFHPGETRRGPISYVSEYVDAGDVAHTYEQDRPGQVRGVPWGMSALIKLKDIDEYDDATLLKQKASSCFAGFIQDSQFAEDPDPPGPDGKDPIETIEPGTLERLPPGKTITFANPASTRDYPDFIRAQLRAVSVGYGITYEALTGDYSEGNFSNSRMGWIEMGRNVKDWQQNLMIPQFCCPIWEWFKEAAVFAGLGIESVECDWTAPRREMIDPAAEIKAQTNAIRAGLTTHAETLRENGWEPEEALDEMEEGWEQVDARGLILDCDPRNVTGQGQLDGKAAAEAQAAAPGGSARRPSAAPEVDDPAGG